jgi:hypothetical protein
MEAKALKQLLRERWPVEDRRDRRAGDLAHTTKISPLVHRRAEPVESRRGGNSESLPCVSSPERGTDRKEGIRSGQERSRCWRVKERRPAIRTIHGWAISVLQEAGAVREREEHGWMQDRADPHARE